jgi:hypothetical protein
VRASLFGDASHALKVGAQLPEERGMADVDAERAQRPEIPAFAARQLPAPPSSSAELSPMS